MNVDSLVEIVHGNDQEKWAERNKRAFESLFGAPNGRYPKNAESVVALRAPEMEPEAGVPFAAYIHPSNPKSGPYSGMSFVVFPSEGEPCLFGLVVGTQGLAPDEATLGKPGHARKLQAIRSWLNACFGNGSQVAWAKQDPTRTDLTVPDELKREWSAYKAALERYGQHVYALFRPRVDRHGTEKALTAFLDLFFSERGYAPTAKYKPNSEAIQAEWFAHLMPNLSQDQVLQLLATRRFVILQGPPGTGKTRMALNLLERNYGSFGRSIQFHPNTTYESFIGGLAPEHSFDQLGLRFSPKPGFLMEAIAAAQRDRSRNYLLHIDEINRADLGKILGEALFLLEANADSQRIIELAFDFGPPFNRTLSVPDNLHILGTMNSADRSIAIVDLAVRRRFRVTLAANEGGRGERL